VGNLKKELEENFKIFSNKEGKERSLKNFMENKMGKVLS